MSVFRVSQMQVSAKPRGKHSVRSQFGAICYRMRKGEVQVLLITSRGRGRWIIPKGWPMPELTPAEAAAQEAYEEAGVEGRAHPLCLGIYAYAKGRDRGGLPRIVAVYAMRVDRLLRSYPEKGQRKRRWFSLEAAAALVEEPELRALLAHFRPAGLPPAHSPRHRRS